MELVKQKAEFIPLTLNLNNVEIAGRTCYKSDTDKITNESSRKFAIRMIENGHLAMLEHCRLIIEFTEVFRNCLLEDRMSGDTIETFWRFEDHFSSIPYIYCQIVDKRLFVCGDLKNLLYCGDKNILRALKTWEPEIVNAAFPINTISKYLVEVPFYTPDLLLSEKHKVDLNNPNENKFNIRKEFECYSMRFITDRGVSHELVRHRTFSFAQESTRYCNYSKDKFNNALTFVEPLWLYNENTDPSAAEEFVDILNDIENWYNKYVLRHNCTGLLPQEARDMLPSCLKTEIVVTGNRNAWEHFFDLRYYEKTGQAHPQMKELATLAMKEFKRNCILF